IQLNLFDGRNITIKKNDYSVGDTIVFKLPEQEIKEKFSMEKGNFVFLYKGKKKGEQGTIEEVKEGKIKIKNANGDIIMTEKEYAFVIGKNKPFVKITN
ncbi:30S ribosomal protein S4e, partial [archaeon]|nr:30S ribosomal protein S4e [archaeon]